MKYDQGKRRPKLFRQPKRRGPLLPISLVIIALLILLFSLVQPFQFITNINPANVVVPTFTPTATPLPLPTDVHGGHIVFTCTRDDINQICIINADGSGYRQLTHVTTNAYYPAIAPDSSAVVYAVNQYDNFDLYQYNLRNNKTVQLTSNLGNSFSPDYSPDGKQIVFVNKGKDGPSTLWVMGSDGKDPHQLYTGPKNIA